MIRIFVRGDFERKKRDGSSQLRNLLVKYFIVILEVRTRIDFVFSRDTRHLSHCVAGLRKKLRVLVSLFYLRRSINYEFHSYVTEGGMGG